MYIAAQRSNTHNILKRTQYSYDIKYLPPWTHYIVFNYDYPINDGMPKNTYDR